MLQYHKIQSVYKRDPDTKFKTFLQGEFSIPEFKYLALNHWVGTEKVDGTNIKVHFQDGKLEYGGKTDNAQIPAPLVQALIATFGPKLALFGDTFDAPDVDVYLFGEGYGAKIQKGGGSYRPDQGFVLFDVWVNGWWLQRESVEDIATILGLDVVPIVAEGTLLEMVDCVRAGFDSQWGDFRAEGLVLRPSTELKTRSGHRIITKVKCKDFVV